MSQVRKECGCVCSRAFNLWVACACVSERPERGLTEREKGVGEGGGGKRERETCCPPTQRNDSGNLYLYSKGLRIGFDWEA
jgi:hypothetical protein